ncbi:MAG: 2-oxoglutarate and iron-dependent oxygenase domain-containing protein [Alphaproteobacteria bacterium]
MGQTPRIPVIDVDDLIREPGPTAHERVAAEIHDACTGVGFFYLAGHGVDPRLVEDAFEANRRFHARPLEEKLALKQNRWHRGYQAFAASTLVSSARFEAARRPNQLESFFVRHEVAADHPDFEKKPLQGPNRWPDDPWFVDVVRRYDAATRELGMALLPAFSLAVGEAPDFFTKLFQPAATALRLIHYPPMPATRPDDLFGIHPHTDYGFLTILAQDEVGGLQIRTVDGEWIEAPRRPGCFVLNIGDILARWTNGRFNSTPHRVVNPSTDRERYSIGQFFDPNLDAVIAPLSRFATPSAPEPIRYGDYFAMRLDANYPDRVGVAAAE